MADKKLESKIIKLDPLAKRLDEAGYRGGAGKLPKSYAKTLLKQAKPKFFTNYLIITLNLIHWLIIYDSVSKN